ncbi:hypothetical protein QQX98_011359 [Neonectria punicea]|uniref:Beta-lactamase-related domain-containing protein n=1 Tax=Neonectria punicea TaxID=979145 RepID=A0ABR1GM94_9HYPO
MAKSFHEQCQAESSPSASGVTGLAVLALDKSGNRLIGKYYGRRESIVDDPITEESAFWLYSITKTISAVALLQCVERGKIGLDDEVYHLLPELKDFQVIGHGPDGTQTLTPHKKKITLRHLLAHTSGIGAFCGDSKKAYTIPLLFKPGEGWAYGGGVEWAGILLERLEKVKLGEYLNANVFDPLGMTSTTFHPDRDPDVERHLVETQHTYLG